MVTDNLPESYLSNALQEVSNINFNLSVNIIIQKLEVQINDYEEKLELLLDKFKNTFKKTLSRDRKSLKILKKEKILRVYEIGEFTPMILNAIRKNEPKKFLDEIKRRFQKEHANNKESIILTIKNKLSTLPKYFSVMQSLQEEHLKLKAYEVLSAESIEAFTEVIQSIKNIQKYTLYNYPVTLIEKCIKLLKVDDELNHNQPIINSFSQSLKILKEVKDNSYLLTTLTALMPRLPTHFLSEALHIARAIVPQKDKLEAFLVIASNSENPEIYHETLQIIKTIEEEANQSIYLERLAPYSKEYFLDESLRLIKGMQEKPYRVRALTVFAPYIQGSLLRDALSLIRKASDASEQIRALIAFAPYLQGSLLRDALSLIRKASDPSKQIRTLTAFAPYLQGDFLRQAWQIATSLTSMNQKVEAISVLGNYQPKNFDFIVISIFRNCPSVIPTLLKRA